METLKTQILKLREQGFNYSEISNRLSCSRSTAHYHSKQENAARNYVRSRKNRKHSLKSILCVKLHRFANNQKVKKDICLKKTKSTWQKTLSHRLFDFAGKNMKPLFKTQDIVDKFGEITKCYLTGVDIDLKEPGTYQFDHIIPRSRGGSSELDNLGICTKEVNAAKSDKTPQELIELCKKILTYNSYNVTKEVPKVGIEPT